MEEYFGITLEEEYEEYIPSGYYFKDDLDGGRLVKKENPINRMLQWFKFDHLPTNLKEVSAHCCELAKIMDTLLPEGAEKTAGLRKLLEAKDCFVRAVMEQQVEKK